MYYYARTGNVNAVQSTKETLPGDPGPAVNLGRWLDGLRYHTRVRCAWLVLDALGMRWPAAGLSREQDWARLLDEALDAARARPAAPRRDGACLGAGAAAALGEILYGIQHGAADGADRHLARGLRVAVYYYARTGNVNAVQSTKETLPGDPGPVVNLGRWLYYFSGTTRACGGSGRSWTRSACAGQPLNPAGNRTGPGSWTRLRTRPGRWPRHPAGTAPARPTAARPRSARSWPASSTAPPAPPTPNLARSLRAAVEFDHARTDLVNAPQYIQVTLPGDPGPGEPGRLAVRAPERTDAPAAGSAGAGDAEHAYPGVGDHEIEQ